MSTVGTPEGFRDNQKAFWKCLVFGLEKSICAPWAYWDYGVKNSDPALVPGSFKLSHECLGGTLYIMFENHVRSYDPS